MMMSYKTNISVALPLRMNILQNAGNIECVRNIVDQSPTNHGLGSEFLSLSSLSDYIEDNTSQNSNTIDENNKLYHNLSCFFSMEGDRKSHLIDMSDMSIDDFVDVTRKKEYVSCSIIGIVSDEEHISDLKESNKVASANENSTAIIFQSHNLNTGELKLQKSSIIVEDSSSALITNAKLSGSDISIINVDGSRNLILQDESSVYLYETIQAKEINTDYDKNDILCKQMKSETYDIIRFSTGESTISLLSYVDSINVAKFFKTIHIDQHLSRTSALLIANHFFSSVRAISNQSAYGELYAAGGMGKIMMSLLSMQTLFLMIALQCTIYYYNRDISDSCSNLVFTDGSSILIEILKLEKDYIGTISEDIINSNICRNFVNSISRLDIEMLNKNPDVISFIDKLYIRNVNNNQIKCLLLNYINYPEKSHSKIRNKILECLTGLA